MITLLISYLVAMQRKKSQCCILCDIDTGLSIGHQDQLAVTRQNMHSKTPQIIRRVKVRIVILCMLLPNYLMIMTSVQLSTVSNQVYYNNTIFQNMLFNF